MKYGQPTISLVAGALRRRTLDRKSWFQRLLDEPQRATEARARPRRTRIRPVTDF